MILFIAVAVVFAWQGERFLLATNDYECEKPDVVVILAGSPKEDPARVIEGAAVFQEKNADYLMFPLRHPRINWSWLVKKYRIKAKVPKEKVLIGRASVKDRQTNQELGGTFTEAGMTIRLMEQKKNQVGRGGHFRLSYPPVKAGL